MQMHASRLPSNQRSGDMKGFTARDASVVLLNYSNLWHGEAGAESLPPPKIRLPRPAKAGHPVTAPRRRGIQEPVRVCDAIRTAASGLWNCWLEGASEGGRHAMNFVEANGARSRAIRLGTMTLTRGGCVDAVEPALCVGYRHIDTAERYRNESEVGEGLRRGLRAAGLEREHVFVTTKVYHDQLAAADFERSL